MESRNAQYVADNFPEGEQILIAGRELLLKIRAYQDGTNEVRAAISKPTPENEEAAWRKIGPSVMLLKECFEHSQSLDRIIPDILDELCSQVNDYDIGKTDRNRGLARLLADLMQNAFEFDLLKLSVPAIQNDFSYYRRTLPRMVKSQDEAIVSNVIPQDVSNRMTLFYAYHNPMVKTVVESASQFAKDSRNEQLVLDCISALAAGSFNTVKQGKADSPESERLCVLVLATCCILYDWISPSGIGGEQSSIDSKAVLNLASEHTLADSTSADKVIRTNCKTLR
ncbi:hypothetical protein EV174_000602 [Coemansia sp. RSA 2320]|nr:hypothetical protein EV174_000602 [Coemansia sp. RSA 2320]